MSDQSISTSGLSNLEGAVGSAWSRRIDRRKALMVMGLGTVSAAAAACSSSPKPSAATTTSDGRKLLDVLGLSSLSKEELGGNLTIPMACDLPLSGGGAFFGQQMQKGALLGFKTIREAGGPNFNVKYTDNGSGNPQLGITNVRGFGLDGYHLMIASYAGDLLAEIPEIGQYEILTLDPGGGTLLAGQGKPYFYGVQTRSPNDQTPTILQYIKRAYPDARVIGMMGSDFGPAQDAAVGTVFKQQCAQYGFTAGPYLTAPTTQTSFTSQISQLGSSTDAVLNYLPGSPQAAFGREWLAAGLTKPVCFVGDYNTQTDQAAGGTFENPQFTFTLAYFNPVSPPNNLAAIIVDQFNKTYGSVQDFNGAYYSCALMMWELVRRAIAKKTSIHSGPDLLKVFEGDLTFTTAFGGSGSKLGTLTFDPTNHSVKHLPLSVIRVTGGVPGTVHVLATGDITGENFKMT